MESRCQDDRVHQQVAREKNNDWRFGEENHASQEKIRVVNFLYFKKLWTLFQKIVSQKIVVH